MDRSGRAPKPEASVTRAFKQTLAPTDHHTSRRGEAIRLDKQLQMIGLMRYPIPGDGNCLYGALSHQLEIQANVAISPLEVKRRIFHRMRTQESYRHLFEAEVIMDFGSFNEYLQVKEFGTGQVAWGGLPEVIVFCDEFQRRACLFMHNSSFNMDPSPSVGPPAGNALLIAYVGQNHYDSVVALGSHKFRIPSPFVRILQVETPQAVLKQNLRVELYDDACLYSILDDLLQQHGNDPAWRVHMPYSIEVGIKSGVTTPGAKFYLLDVSSFQEVVAKYESIVARIVAWQPPPEPPSEPPATSTTPSSTGARLKGAWRRATSPFRSASRERSAGKSPFSRRRSQTPENSDARQQEKPMVAPPAPKLPPTGPPAKPAGPTSRPPAEPGKRPQSLAGAAVAPVESQRPPVAVPPAAPRGPPPRPAPVQTQPEPVLFEETMVVIKDVGHPGRNEVACATVTPTRLELVKSDGQSLSVPINEVSIQPSLVYPFDSRYFQVFHKHHRLIHFFSSRTPTSNRFRQLVAGPAGTPPDAHSMWSRLQLEQGRALSSPKPASRGAAGAGAATPASPVDVPPPPPPPQAPSRTPTAVAEPEAGAAVWAAAPPSQRPPSLPGKRRASHEPPLPPPPAFPTVREVSAPTAAPPPAPDAPSGPPRPRPRSAGATLTPRPAAAAAPPAPPRSGAGRSAAGARLPPDVLPAAASAPAPAPPNPSPTPSSSATGTPPLPPSLPPPVPPVQPTVPLTFVPPPPLPEPTAPARHNSWARDPSTDAPPLPNAQERRGRPQDPSARRWARDKPYIEPPTGFEVPAPVPTMTKVHSDPIASPPVRPDGATPPALAPRISPLSQSPRLPSPEMFSPAAVSPRLVYPETSRVSAPSGDFFPLRSSSPAPNAGRPPSPSMHAHPRRSATPRHRSRSPQPGQRSHSPVGRVSMPGAYPVTRMPAYDLQRHNSAGWWDAPNPHPAGRFTSPHRDPLWYEPPPAKWGPAAGGPWGPASRPAVRAGSWF